MNALSIPRPISTIGPSSPARAVSPATAPVERRSRRKIPCSHCRERLPVPSNAETRRRTPFLVCPRCARRTAVPTVRLRLLQLAGVVVVLAAWAFVIFTWLREN